MLQCRVYFILLLILMFSYLQAGNCKKPSRAEAEKAVETLIRWAGDNPNREGLKDTPARVVRSYEEFFSGYNQDPKEILDCHFQENSERYQQVVILKDIRLESYCEHHMVPIIGKVHVAYLPAGRYVGLSKLARLVEALSKRLQIQENLTVEIAENVNDHLQPAGVAVIVEASHQCMSTRGVHKVGSTMITSHMMGEFLNNPKTRQELLMLIRG